MEGEEGLWVTDIVSQESNLVFNYVLMNYLNFTTGKIVSKTIKYKLILKRHFNVTCRKILGRKINN